MDIFLSLILISRSNLFLILLVDDLYILGTITNLYLCCMALLHSGIDWIVSLCIE